PQGTPTYSFSARCASRGRWSTGRSRPPRSHRAVSAAHSRAADEDRPDPTGTSEETASRAPGTENPAARSAQTIAATYPARAGTAPGVNDEASNSTPESNCVELTVHRGL